jgi:hypothetical protein
MFASLIPAIGALGFGSVIASMVVWWSGICNRRQDWIEGTRADLATTLSALNALHCAARESHTEKKAREDVMLAVQVLSLRLHTGEAAAEEFLAALEELAICPMPASEYRIKLEAATYKGRRLLKRKWLVAKYGPFARAMVWS